MQTASTMVHAAEMKQLAIDLKKAVWIQNAVAEARRPPAAAAVFFTEMTAQVIPLEMRPTTHWTPAMLPNRGYLDVNGCFPRICILDTGAVTTMINKEFAIVVGVDLTRLHLGRPFMTAGGRVEHSFGVTDFLTFTLIFLMSSGAAFKHRL